MKTTDLIPLILYQLADGDKYGYEIVKQIEDISGGKISIKQPTLYSLLKKLEQGKFISSYWQDSEIGGKRHYYRLTDNGKAQLDTYPALATLIADEVGDVALTTATNGIENLQPVNTKNENVNIDKPETVVEPSTVLSSVNTSEFTTQESIKNSEIIDDTSIKPIHIDLTSNIDTTVNTSDYNINENIAKELPADTNKPIDINIDTDMYNIVEVDNTIDEISPIIDDLTQEINKVEEIADAEDIKRYPAPQSSLINIFDAIEPSEPETEIKPKNNLKDDIQVQVEQPEIKLVTDTASNTVNNKLYGKLTPNKDLLLDNLPNKDDIEPAQSTNIDIERVPYLDYVDLGSSPASIKRKKSITKHIQKMCLTCFTLLLAIAVSLVFCFKYEFSKVYYIFLIVAVVLLIAYPAYIIIRLPNMRLKYCSKPFKYLPFLSFFVRLSIFLSVTMVVFGYNLSTNKGVVDIFKLQNFASIYAPLLLTSVVLLDFVYGLILYRKYKK